MAWQFLTRSQCTHCTSLAFSPDPQLCPHTYQPPQLPPPQLETSISKMARKKVSESDSAPSPRKFHSLPCFLLQKSVCLQLPLKARFSYPLMLCELSSRSRLSAPGTHEIHLPSSRCPNNAASLHFKKLPLISIYFTETSGSSSS